MNGAKGFLQLDDKVLPSWAKRYNSWKQGEASFRVLYYGGATGSVPFVWESQPGTPKHKLNDYPLPPLTPPPQYHSSPLASPSLDKKSKKKKKKNSPKIFNSMFARSSSSTSKRVSSPPPSSSYSSPFSPFPYGRSNAKAGLRSVDFDDEDEDEDDEYYKAGKGSPTSTLCFSNARNGRWSGKKKKKGGYHFYPIKSVKKAVKSIACHLH